MTRILLLYFAAVHLAPFVIVGKRGFGVLGLVVTAAIGGAFAAGAALGARRWSAPPRAVLVCAPPRFGVPAVALCYVAIRAPDIIALVKALMAGTFAQYALSLAVDRYASGGEPSALFNVGTILFFVLCGSAAAEASASMRHRPWPRLALGITVLIAMMVESASLARAGVVLGLTLAGTFWLFNSREMLRDWRPRTIALACVGATFAGAAVFLFSAYFRLGSSDDVNDVLFQRAGSYLLGGHEAFLRWLVAPSIENPRPVGFNTFSFVFKLFGASVPQGYYEPLDTSFGETNIFLVYRGLITDFGIVGALLVTAMVGFGIARLDVESPSPAVVWYGSCAACLVLFPLISPLSFTTFGAALIVLLLLVHLKTTTPTRGAITVARGRRAAEC